MLRPRIIPCLLIRDGGLVKTVQFGEGKYVGDPINAVKIFNEKEADELIVLDIDATAQNRDPDYRMIAHVAAECRMPLCYGGGVRTAEQAKRIIGLGVEKVAVSSAGVANSRLYGDMASDVGSQSVVMVLDVKKRAWRGGYEVYTHNGSRRTRLDPFVLASEAEQLGVGEVVINSIDRDGVMTGYDLELAARTRAATRLPITMLGGAGSLQDLQDLVATCGIVGAAAGSLFVFKGTYRAVLISYPNESQKRGIYGTPRQSANATLHES